MEDYWSPPYASLLLSHARSLWPLRCQSASRLQPPSSLQVDARTSIVAPHRGPLCALDVDRFDESLAIVGGGDGSASLFDLAAAVVEDPREWRPITAPRITIRRKKDSAGAHATAITSIQWFPLDCGAFSTSSFDGLVKVWDTETFTSVFEFDLGGSVYCSRMHPHGNIIAASSSTHTVRMCDLRTGGSTHAFMGHDRRVTAIDFSSANEYVFATASLDKSIKLWDMRKSSKSAVIRAFDGHQGSDHDGDNTFLSPNTSAVANSAAAKSPCAHDIAAMSLRFLSCGTRIASVGGDGSTRLWDAFSGRVLYNMSHGGSDWRTGSYDIDVGRSHTSTYAEYDDLVFAPGRREGEIAMHQLGATDAYGRARVRRRDVAALSGHLKMVRGLRYLSSRRILISAGMDGLLLLWRTSPPLAPPASGRAGQLVLGPFTGEDPFEEPEYHHQQHHQKQQQRKRRRGEGDYAGASSYDSSSYSTGQYAPGGMGNAGALGNEDAWSDNDDVEDNGTTAALNGEEEGSGRYALYDRRGSIAATRSERIRGLIDAAASSSSSSSALVGSATAVAVPATTATTTAAAAAVSSRRPRAFLPPIIRQMLQEEEEDREGR